ncbi:zinc-ribbon domain-containing protein [Rhodocaloribacter sp.]
MAHLVCEECGARIPEGADRCELCGTPVPGAVVAAEKEPVVTVEGENVVVAEEPPVAAEGTAEPPALPTGAGKGVFCNACGWPNPPGSRYCSQCGAKLDARVAGASVASPSVPATPPPAPAPPPVAKATIPVAKASAPAPKAPGEGSATTAQSAVGRQVAILVGAGILLVVGLYMITVVSKEMGGGAAAPPPTAQAAPQAAPLPADVAEQAEALQAEIDQLTGAARLEKRRELVSLYIREERYDLAAEEQERIAEAENTEDAWVLVGNLNYDWMERQSAADRAVFAKRAIAGYQRALEINPDNLDVRTDMAIAYMYDPDNPMKAIQETNKVLERNPDHVQANFNRGIMLMQINRMDEAVTQMEKVKRLVNDPDDPVYQRAERVIEMIRDSGN